MEPFFSNNAENILVQESLVEFKIIKDEKNYLIQIGKSTSSEKLGIKLKNLSSVTNIYHENFFTLEELQKLNIIFFNFNNLDNVISKTKDIFYEKNISLKFENNNVILNVNISKDNNEEKLISLELKQKLFTLGEICQDLCKEVLYLKNKMKEKDKKNANKINELKNEINQLKNEINQLKNGGKDLKINDIEKINKPIVNNEIKVNNNEIKIDSKILIKKQEIDFITNRLKFNGKYKNISYRLLYRKTRDGEQAINFHQKCDGVPKTISIFKTVKGRKFGGYIDKAWSCNGGWIKNDENCFIFSIDLMKIYNPLKGMDKYYCNKSYGPNFSEFGLYNHIVGKNSFVLSVNVKEKDEANKYFSGFNSDYEINGGESKFQLDELEVYQVIFQ